MSYTRSSEDFLAASVQRQDTVSLQSGNIDHPSSFQPISVRWHGC